MHIDRLQGLLERFRPHAQMFHSGPLCGLSDFAALPDLGQLHLVRAGRVLARHAGHGEHEVCEPSLLFYPRPLAHRFVTDPEHGADMACAQVRLGGGPLSPLAQALPPVVVLALVELPGAQALLQQLFDEAFGARCGRRLIVDRLFEVVLILLLRHLIDSGQLRSGPLAGLAHPQLARALVAMHAAPQQAWSLATLAQRAGLSRSRFAQLFAATVGTPPAAYLASFRITLAQQLLREGQPLKRIADAVGYAGAPALSRAFAAHCGAAPRAWVKRQRAPFAAVAE